MQYINFNKFTLFFVICLFSYILFIVTSNLDRGIDTTDESYYILVAKYLENWYLSPMNEGYYTQVIYKLTNWNIKYVRGIGILLLLLSSFMFSINLLKFITAKFNIKTSNTEKYLFVITITMSSLIYYQHWLFTPSYNLLQIVSINFIISFLLIIINNYKNIESGFFKLEYILLSFFYCTSFLIKPTTAIIMAIISIFIYNYSKIDKKTVAIIIILSIFILYFQIIFINGSIFEYINKVKISLDIINTIDSGYNLKENFFQFFIDFYYYIFKYKMISLSIPFLLFSLYIIFFLKNKINIKIIYYSLVSILFIVFYILIIKYNYESLWFIFIIFTINIYMIYGFIYYFEDFKYFKIKELLKTIPFVVILTLLSFAFSFGTNNSMIPHMNLSFVFSIAGIMTLIYINDNKQVFIKINIFLSIFISILTLNIIEKAYQNPYRLNTSIKYQTEKVDILGGVKVDKDLKNYIDKLLEIKIQNNIVYLLDMTGATSGANIILEAKYVGAPWLLGGYKGSNASAYKILSNVPSEKLKNSWILISPKGRRALDINLLNKLNLSFPKNYVKIGTLFLKSRNETQELWKPISNN